MDGLGQKSDDWFDKITNVHDNDAVTKNDKYDMQKLKKMNISEN